MTEKMEFPTKSGHKVKSYAGCSGPRPGANQPPDSRATELPGAGVCAGDAFFRHQLPQLPVQGVGSERTRGKQRRRPSAFPCLTSTMSWPVLGGEGLACEELAGPFVLGWGYVTQRRVPPLGVVEDLHVLDDARPRLGPAGVVLVVDQLLLQRGEEALHRCVVPALALVAHAALD